MSSFTCISCRVAFASADLQRAHYKSDWHRYNLKRKVAELPPVTAENFQQRVMAQKAQVEECERETCSQCGICKKFFNTQNAFENHMKSKKHKEAEAKQVQKVQSEVEKQNQKNKEKGLDVAHERAQKDTVNQALAEARKSPGPVKRRVTHGLDPAKVEAIRQLRGRGHRSSSRSKPDDDDEGEWEDEDEEEVIGGDEEEMEMEDSSEDEVDYPGTPLTEGQCLFCSREGGDLDDNMQHMTVEHSFYIPDVEYLVDLEGLIKYLGEKVGGAFFCLYCNEKGRTFYSLEAAQGHMRDKGHTKMLMEGDAMLEYADFYDFRKSYPDYQSEGAAGGQEEEEEPVEKEELRITDDDTQLVLPSGSRVGHRALQRYWRQNLIPSMSHRSSGREAVGRLMAQYKALGWKGDCGEAAQKKVRDMQFVQKLKAKRRVQMGVRNNKFQPHFRPQVVF
ncbi:cytoplasmic 60S subunit biogenesis factor ZNF622-like isoform X1 [Branchiostoma floridae x Branchiostoma belcheri]